ncbi:hypothetical protein IEQ34_006740 [Dendrobium chrysotoxum]|uniref:RING-type domain-containing protein n=1 Tax=Dendrobium chrysotoxum TaxID=161865 RepID=A0AAV7H8H6_DENCH|nr:hypothetical protein IEQ34_006740 [Dendrobium chrysotoxum]
MVLPLVLSCRLDTHSNRASILKEIEVENAAIWRKRRTLSNLFQQEEAADGTLPERAQERPMRVSLMTLLAMGEKLLEDESSTAGGESGRRPMRRRRQCPRRRRCCARCAWLCSRLLVTGRRSCPVCNEGILDVLDIF